MKQPESNNYRARQNYFEDLGLEQKELIGIICEEMEKTEELSIDLNRSLEVKESHLNQIKELSKMNGELRREIHDLNDRYDEVTKSWFSKLFVWKRKLFKLSIRNPFYIQS